MNEFRNTFKMTLISGNLFNYLNASDFSFQNITNIAIDPLNYSITFKFSNDLTIERLDLSCKNIVDKMIKLLFEHLFDYNNYYIDHEQDNIDHNMIEYTICNNNNNVIRDPVGTITFEMVHPNEITFSFDEYSLNCFKNMKNGCINTL